MGKKHLPTHISNVTIHRHNTKISYTPIWEVKHAYNPVELVIYELLITKQKKWGINTRELFISYHKV